MLWSVRVVQSVKMRFPVKAVPLLSIVICLPMLLSLVLAAEGSGTTVKDKEGGDTTTAKVDKRMEEEESLEKEEGKKSEEKESEKEDASKEGKSKEEKASNYFSEGYRKLFF